MSSVRPESTPKHISLKAPMLALKASAGSGKTSALATRYIILLFQGAKPSEILAITFAKKATKEMQERIAQALLELSCDKRDSQFYQNLIREGFSSEQILQSAPTIYQEFLRSKLRILTIDAFFNAILKKFSYFVGLRADFRMIGDSSKEEYASEAMRERFLTAIINSSNSQHLHSPRAKAHRGKEPASESHPDQNLDQNPAQDPHPNPAPPAQNLIQNLPQNLAQNQAQNPSGLGSLFAMREDLDIELDGLLEFVWQCFKDKTHFSKEFFKHYRGLDCVALQEACHAYAQQAMEILLQMRSLLERANAKLAKPKKLDTAYEMLGFSSFEELLKSTRAWLSKDKDDVCEARGFKEILSNDEQASHAFREEYARLCACICAYSQNLEQIAFSHIASVLHSYASAYHSWLTSTQTLRFIDCTLLVYMLLADSARAAVSAEFFYFRMDSVITHILIDEFQDTNATQYHIIKPLIDEIRAGFGATRPKASLPAATPSKGGAPNIPRNMANMAKGMQEAPDNGRSFFIVGDSKQSIYGFRGSEGALFDKVIAELKLQVENLPYNYRSSSEVVAFVNKVFAKIFQDYVPQALPEPSQSGQSAESSAEAGATSGGFVRVCKVQAHTLDPKGAKADERRAVLIASALENLGELLRAGVSANDIAFLCSTNAECASLRAAIKQRFPAINIVLNARAKLTDEPSVRILLSALKLLRALELEASALDSSSSGDSGKGSGGRSGRSPAKLSLNLSGRLSSGARFYLIELAKLLGARCLDRFDTCEIFDKWARESSALDSHPARAMDAAQNLAPESHTNPCATPSPHSPLHSLAHSLATPPINSLAAIKHIITQAIEEVDSHRPSRYLLYLMQRFTLGDKAAQLLLEQSIEHEDIASLLEALESSAPDAPKDNQSGLQILTIHTSKGLEYPYVVILDSAPKPPTSSKILFDKHGALLQLKRIDKRRKSYDHRYQKALEANIARKMLEEHNVLYVACTRAQRGLILLAHNDAKHSRLAPILAQLPLQEVACWEIALDSGAAESSTLESKLPESNLPEFSLPESTTPDSRSQNSSPLDSGDSANVQESALHATCSIVLESGAIIESQKQPTPTPPTPTILTQESYGKQECFITSSEQEEYPSGNIAHIRFGQALHLGLEYTLGYGTPKAQVEGILRYRYGLDSASMGKVLARITALEADAHFQSILAPIFASTPESSHKSGAKNAVQFVEAPLVAGGKSYRLDLLIYDRELEQAIVIDYKSGAKKPSHQKQVQRYLALLQQADSAQSHCAKPSVQGYVLYLGEHIDWLPVAPDLQAQDAPQAPQHT